MMLSVFNVARIFAHDENHYMVYVCMVIHDEINVHFSSTFVRMVTAPMV